MLETMQIVGQDGKALTINKSDFDPKNQKEYSDKSAPKKTVKKADK